MHIKSQCHFCALCKISKRLSNWLISGMKAPSLLQLPVYLMSLFPFIGQFYPRPVLSFGYCRWLCLSVYVCVRVYMCICICEQACPRDNLWPTLARMTEFVPELQTPWSRCLLFWGLIGAGVYDQILLKSPNFMNAWFVHYGKYTATRENV